MEQVETQIVFIRNFPKETEKDAVVELFGQYGDIIQIRIGVDDDTKGTVFVVYKNVKSAKNAVKHMNGYYMNDMYLNVSYWLPFHKFILMMNQKKQRHNNSTL